MSPVCVGIFPADTRSVTTLYRCRICWNVCTQNTVKKQNLRYTGARAGFNAVNAALLSGHATRHKVCGCGF